MKSAVLNVVGTGLLEALHGAIYGGMKRDHGFIAKMTQET